ncbi:MAG: DUF354 domain-containing protein [Bacteroidales bacterium]|nr:DUF354 domain-containing protein [Bacteroidales bacterium]
MKILIDIGHPAHVHIFKCLAFELAKNGHQFLFTVRVGEKETELLKNTGFLYKSIGRKQKGVVNKIIGLLFFTYKIFKISLRFKPDLFLSHGSMYAGYCALLFRKPHISLEDSGNMEQIRLYYPVCKSILSPNILPIDLGTKQIRYLGYHELVYLHPAYFTPDPSIKSLLGVKDNEKYAIVRFVAWSASHDLAQGGMSYFDKIELVRFLSTKMKVYISAEKDIIPELKEYLIDIPFEKMHDALFYATLYVGEGATMASEAGVLGTPSIYVNSIERCYNEDQEKYGLVFNFRNYDGVIEKIDELLKIQNLNEKFQSRRNSMLEDKINVTDFMVWFIENYPQSAQIMQENPDYQLRFK